MQGRDKSSKFDYHHIVEMQGSDNQYEFLSNYKPILGNTYIIYEHAVLENVDDDITVYFRASQVESFAFNAGEFSVEDLTG